MSTRTVKRNPKRKSAAKPKRTVKRTPKRKSAAKPKRTVKRTPKRKSAAKPKVKKRNAGSLIEAALPFAAMDEIGKAAAADLARLRGPVLQRRAVASGRGKGTRRNPIQHRITTRSR